MATVAARGVGSGRAVSDVDSGHSDNSVSQREDLANFISMITRDETPFMSSIGKTKATAIFHEWQTDELNAPGNSIVNEGTDYITPVNNSGVTVSATNDEAGGIGTTNFFSPTGENRTRLGNYTQINGKTIAISGTRRAIDQAGVADEYAYQLKKRGTELRRDLRIFIDPLRSNIRSVNNCRYHYSWCNTFVLLVDFQSWINDPKTVILNGATAAANNLVQVRHAVVPGNAASKVALSLSDIDSVMQMIYEEGGKAGKIMLSPKLRRDFSDLMVTDSGVRRNIDMDGKLRQSVDVSTCQTLVI